jgi:hypothetical protein
LEQPKKTQKEKLLEKKRQIEERIRVAETREREDDRKKDTRRKILAGAVVLEEAAKKPEFHQELMRMIGGFLTRPADRKLFGLSADAPPGTVIEKGSSIERIEQDADAIEAGIRAA